MKPVVLSAGVLFSLLFAGCLFKGEPDRLGASWTERSTGIQHQALTVFWDGNRVLAAGRKGEVAASADGIEWEILRPDTADFYIADIAWNGSRYVAVGFTESGVYWGVTATSVDGRHWTRRIYDSTRSLESVIWTGTKFVAVGRGRASLTSPDGIEWTVHVPDDPGADFAVWNGSLFVAGAGALTITSSIDGITWTTRKKLPDNYQNTVYCGVWSGTHFVLAGKGKVWTSPDGLTWTSWDSGMKYVHTLVKTDASLFAFGVGGEVWSGGLDGKAWRRERKGRINELGESDPTFEMVSAAWTGKRLVSVGTGGRAWTSP